MYPTRRLNPPLPVDEHGNWYRGEQAEEEAEDGVAGSGSGEQSVGNGGGSAASEMEAEMEAAEKSVVGQMSDIRRTDLSEGSTLTDAQQAVLADLEQL